MRVITTQEQMRGDGGAEAPSCLFLWVKMDFQKEDGSCISLTHIQIHTAVDD